MNASKWNLGKHWRIKNEKKFLYLQNISFHQFKLFNKAKTSNVGLNTDLNLDLFFIFSSKLMNTIWKHTFSSEKHPISSHFPCLLHRQIGSSTTLYRPHPPTPPGGTLFLYVWKVDLSWISGYIPFCNFLNNIFRAPSREPFLVLGQSGVWGTWGVESV